MYGDERGIAEFGQHPPAAFDVLIHAPPLRHHHDGRSRALNRVVVDQHALHRHVAGLVVHRLLDDRAEGEG
jgi:hypothetical protein